MTTLTYREAVGKALEDCMRDEPRLILLGQNLTGHSAKQLAKKYGERRVRDISISESTMVGMAVGAAMKGWKAVVMIAYADIAAGRAAVVAQDAVDALAQDGHAGAIEVVSLGLVKPLDRQAVLNSASKNGRVLIVQDEPPWAGYAPYVRCLLDELPPKNLSIPPRIITGADQYMPFWGEKPFLPSVESVTTTAMQMLDIPT